MTIFTATGWAFGITFAFLVLLALTVSLKRGGQEIDLATAFGCQAAAYLLGLFLILRVHGPEESIRRFIGLRRTSAGFYPLAVLVGLAAQLPINALFDLVLRRWPLHEDQKLSEVLAGATTPKRIVMGLVIVLLGPLLEEVLFRGALFRPTLRSHSAAVVIVVTAFLFGFAHLEWQRGLPIAFFGVCLGLLRWVSGSLYPTMVVHVTFNAIPFALAVLKVGDADAPTWTVAASCAALAAALGGIWALGARSAQAAAAQKEDRS